MRKISLLCIASILFLSLSVNLIGQEENPMASFMDAKWGINANVFENTFRYKDELKKKDDGFYLSDFKLGPMTLSEIKFIFKTKGEEKLKLTKRNYNSLYFAEVYIFIKPEQFDELFNIFKVRYGDPQKFDQREVRNRSGDPFLQKVAVWVDKDINREIVMERQASKLVDGVAMFIPHKTEVKVVEKDKTKAAAEKL